MTRFLLGLVCATLALGSKAQELKREKPSERSDFQAALGFELLPAGNMPGGGWRKIVILADETSISQAEYTSMAFRAAHGAIVVVSQTAAADGNVSPFALPGGLRSMISGIGVFYPDKRPTQRIGIVPNVEVKPTIAGIREGRDEVPEEALRKILGSQVPSAIIEKWPGHSSRPYRRI